MANYQNLSLHFAKEREGKGGEGKGSKSLWPSEDIQSLLLAANFPN
jgi:hypothetical protein